MREEEKGIGKRNLPIDNQHVLVMIPAEELEYLKRAQEKILERLDQLDKKNPQQRQAPENYLTAQQFMDAVKIKRWKFDQLIANNLIRTVKKKRKIYVQETEIQRYFTDPAIQ